LVLNMLNSIIIGKICIQIEKSDNSKLEISFDNQSTSNFRNISG
jgi:hypothetical protein